MKLGLLLFLSTAGAYANPLYEHAIAARQPIAATGTVKPNSTTTKGNACALVSAAQSSWLAARPSATTAYVNPSLAVACLNSIPINKVDATTLIQSLRTYLEFQSDKEYLKNPPAGYVNPSYDLDSLIDQISTNVEAGTYKSEVEFQQDIYFALQQAYDGHLYWQSDILNGVFSFSISSFLGLASVSMDGIQDPQLYFVSDLIDIGETAVVPKTGFTPSYVTKLNGVNVTQAVQTLGLLTGSQDPDARYNTMLYSLGNIRASQGQLTSSSIPPKGDYVHFEFANGTSVQLGWRAAVLQDFSNVTDGRSAYQIFAPFASLHSDEVIKALVSAALPTATASATTTTHHTSATQTATQKPEATDLPNIPYYPLPVVKDDANLIAGYFLNGTGYTDVAVLQVTGFQPAGAASDNFVAQFSETLAAFLSNATEAGKKKLIIDLQGNGGGAIDLGTDMYAQLFPNQHPDMSANMRRSLGMDIVISSASAKVDSLGANATAADLEAYANSPFAYQYDVDPSGKNIDSTKQLLDGITYGGANFTTFFQTNYSDPLASLVTGFQITQTNASAKPPFAPEDIIILTDGICASTCTSFSERMKNLAGVQFMVVGGRPQHQPVQAIGGIKGSQIFTFQNIAQMHELFYNGSAAQLQSVKGTEWEHFTFYPIVRTAGAAQKTDPLAGFESGGVNGRSSFRIGDSSHTPLQYVYEAADCRIWFTKEMLYNPIALWNRVTDVAFRSRTGSKFNSPYCTAGSTGHPTSISGGWKQGTLGPQDQGKIEAASPIFKNAPWSSKTNGSDKWQSVDKGFQADIEIGNIKAEFGVDPSEFDGKNCEEYTGSMWLVQVMCKAYQALH